MRACPSSSPWQQTVVELKALSNPNHNGRDVALPRHLPEHIDRSRRANKVSTAHITERVVRVTDRCSTQTATIEWCDPTSCRYGHQTWRIGVAKHPGVCAVSGNFIKRGDPVYRPWGSRPLPRNAKEMILAHVIDQMPCDGIA